MISITHPRHPARGSEKGRHRLKKIEHDLLLTLAETVQKMHIALLQSQAQLEALRTVVIGVHTALYDDPAWCARITSALTGAIESDFCQALGSTYADDILRQRQQWLANLMPADIWSQVRPRQMD